MTMYRTLAKLLANPNSAQLVRASCHQWKPVSVGSCLASSTYKRTKIKPYSRFGDHLKQTPTSTLLVSTTSTNSNIRARLEGLVLNQKYKRLLNKHRNILIASLVGSGLVTFVVSSFETIPYSKRTHFVLVPRWFEKILVEIVLESVLKGEYKGKVLPSTNPTSERMALISESLIKALQKGLTQEKVWGWKQGCNMREARRYLKHVEWEVVVIDDPEIIAISSPDGRIFLHTGLIEYFKSDAEIATIIAHEIGHVVARTSAEKITMYMGLAIPRLLKYTYNFHMPHIDYDLTEYSLSRRLELEADYIGLLLMASAGYDPRIAVIVWHKLAEIEEYYSETSTHPSSKMRVQFVSQALEEAMLFYDQSS